MSRTRIIPSSLRSSLLSRKHCASILRPPNLPGAPGLLSQLSLTATRVGIHPNGSHLSLPPFAALRAFSTSPPRSSTTPAYSYSVSAAYSDKRQKLDLARNHFSYSPLSRIAQTTPPETERPRAASGQDAYFISGIGETSSLAFGVVDGVGGWEESGVDPADFAHSLCDYMADAAARYPYGLEKIGKSIAGGVRPVELLDMGYERVMEDKAIAAGGCTACVATVTAGGVLSVANLGDSGYIHLSPFRLNYLSPAQTHRFNTPFQLSKLPPKMLEQVALFGGAKPYSEVPADAAQTTQQLAHGDVLVFATDGVWDNLSAEDALRLVTRLMVRLKAWVLPEEGEPQTCKPSNVPPNFREILANASIKVPSSSSRGDVDASVRGLSAVLATAVTHEAKVASLDRKRDGPFAREVQRLYPDENWRGGKADDICAVVAVVCQDGM